jgi:hypothetical protein
MAHVTSNKNYHEKNHIIVLCLFLAHIADAAVRLTGTIDKEADET